MAFSNAMKDLFEDVRAVAEPSGALALAGMKKYIALHNIRGERLAHILSGANVNFHGLRYVSERCELGEQREALLAVTIPEEKGSFLKFCQLLGGRSVTEFNYRFAASGETWPMERPEVPPEKRPSVISAQALPRPIDFRKLVG